MLKRNVGTDKLWICKHLKDSRGAVEMHVFSESPSESEVNVNHAHK